MIDNTGFDFDRPPDVPVTPRAVAETLRLMREVVAPELAEVYPQFAEQCSESRPRLKRLTELLAQASFPMRTQRAGYSPRPKIRTTRKRT